MCQLFQIITSSLPLNNGTVWHVYLQHDHASNEVGPGQWFQGSIYA